MNRNLSFPGEIGVGAGLKLSRAILALAPVLIIFLVQLMIWPIIRPYAWFLFILAVFLSAWIGGRWFGILATVVAALLIWYFFLPPERSFVNRNVGSVVAMLTFLGMGVVFSLFHDRLKRAILEVAEALAANRYQAQLESVFQAIQDGIVVTDMEGHILLANEAGARMFGFPSAEAMKRDIASYREFFEYSYPDGRPLPFEEWPINKVLKGESIRDYELRARRRDVGQARFLCCSGEPVRDEDGKQTLAVVGTRDITERKQDEEKLRKSEQRLRLALKAARLGVFERDVQTDRPIWENERMYEIFGLTRADAALSKAQITGNYMHPDDVSTFERTLADGMKSGRPFHTVYRIHRKDGALRWLDLDGIFELAPDGAPTRMIGVLADITERKQAEAEREQLAQEQAARAVAEAANRSKDEFLALVSHELRSPLNAILGYTRMLRSGPIDRDAINNVTNVVERNAKAQLQIIEDLLDSARIVTGKLCIEPGPVDLTPVLEAALDTVRAAAEAKGVTLLADFGPAPEEALGDPTRLQQIVWNLLTNAVKFTPEGGRVELRMEGVADHIRIIVSDTGRGIEPEFLPFVFDRFRQADPSCARRYGGLGLGLSLVKHLVELHGGTITAVSEGVGRGSTFTVTLPRR